jgi:hypothetical protein
MSKRPSIDLIAITAARRRRCRKPCSASRRWMCRKVSTHSQRTASGGVPSTSCRFFMVRESRLAFLVIAFRRPSFAGNRSMGSGLLPFKITNIHSHTLICECLLRHEACVFVRSAWQPRPGPVGPLLWVSDFAINLFVGEVAPLHELSEISLVMRINVSEIHQIGFIKSRRHDAIAKEFRTNGMISVEVSFVLRPILSFEPRRCFR